MFSIRPTCLPEQTGMGRCSKTIKVLGITSLFILISAAGTSAATFDFSPSTGTFNQSCQYTVDIAIDATGEVSNSADIEITYDPNELEVIDSDTSLAGIQIEGGTAYESYIGNSVNSITGVITLTGVSFSEDLSSEDIFGRITFEPLTATSSSPTFEITFDGVGETTDSNVAESSTGDDLLTSVTNATYTFAIGTCDDDSAAPEVVFVNPQDGKRNVSVNTDFTIDITDDSSGVDLTTVQIEIDGIIYENGDPEVTSVTAITDGYRFVINPSSPLSSGTIVMRVTASDNDGNEVTEYGVINFPSSGGGGGSRSCPTATGAPTCAPVPTQITCPVTTPLPTPTPATEVRTRIIEQVREICTPGQTTTPDEEEIEENSTPTPIPTLSNDIVDNDDLEFCINPVTGEVQNKDDVINPISCIEDINKLDGLFDRIPIFKFIFEKIELNGLLSIPIIITSLLSMVPYLTSFSALSLVWAIFGFVAGKRHDKPWGLVLDEVTNRPVRFAICRLFTPNTLTLIDQTLTDNEGRYTFQVDTGNYRLEVVKPGYEIYKEEFTIQPEEKSYVYDVHLRPTHLIEGVIHHGWINNFWNNILDAYTKVLPFIFTIGFTLSIISFMLKPGLIQLIILVFNILFFIFNFLSRLDFRSKYSSVVDSTTNLRIPNVLIKIFDTKTWQMVDTKLSNQHGYFDYRGEPGEYVISAQARGFRFPSKQKENTNYILNKENKSMQKVSLKKGGNELTLYMDRII